MRQINTGTTNNAAEMTTVTPAVMPINPRDEGAETEN